MAFLLVDRLLLSSTKYYCSFIVRPSSGELLIDLREWEEGKGDWRGGGRREGKGKRKKTILLLYSVERL